MKPNGNLSKKTNGHSKPYSSTEKLKRRRIAMSLAGYGYNATDISKMLRVVGENVSMWTVAGWMAHRTRGTY